MNIRSENDSNYYRLNAIDLSQTNLNCCKMPNRLGIGSSVCHSQLSPKLSLYVIYVSFSFTICRIFICHHIYISLFTFHLISCYMSLMSLMSLVLTFIFLLFMDFGLIHKFIVSLISYRSSKLVSTRKRRR